VKAIVQNDYGGQDVLSLKSVSKPKINENEMLVRVHASSVNAGDIFSMRGTPYMVRFSVGFPKPKDYILGWDVSGTIEEMGNNVNEYKVGDEIFGSCNNAFAEYVKMDAEKMAMKPSNLTFEEAASMPTAAITALQQLRDSGKIQNGQQVLITGASGGVGSFAVQIAKSFGAKVTGVCRTEKVDMVYSMGADHVIDYKREDFTKGERQFDLILDNVGKWKFSDMMKVLTPNGRIIPNTGHGGMRYVIKAFAIALYSSKITGMKVADLNRSDFSYLKDLVESGEISPIVDRIYPFEDTAKAIAYLESGQVKGKVVISMSE
jgi:NADPH:quinone reductase-like Zn-dependent oxidoreductase